MSAELKRKFSEMKVGELRQELGKLGLDKTGVKAVLVDRLVEFYQMKEGDGAVITGSEKVEEQSSNSNSQTVEGTVEEEEDMDESENEEQYNDEESGGKFEYTESKEIFEDSESEQQEESVELEIGENLMTKENEIVEAEVNEKDQPSTTMAEKADDIGQENGSETTTEVVIGSGDSKENEKTGAKGTEEENNETQGSSSKSADIPTGEQAQDNNAVEGNPADTENDGNPKQEPERHILLVTGLSKATSANDLKTFFRKYGKIGRIKIMTNTRVPGSQRFAHVSVPSLTELNHLVATLDKVKLRGKTIRVFKAPDDGSVSSSYEIAVANATEGEETEDDEGVKDEGDNDSATNGGEMSTPKTDGTKAANEKVEPGGADTNVASSTATGSDKTSDKKTEKTESKSSSNKDRKVDNKAHRPSGRGHSSHHSRRDSHERHRDVEGYRHSNRGFRRDRPSNMEWRRHGPPRGPMEITRVQRDRPPMGRGGHLANAAPRRRSPHAAQLTFEQIREIREEQRRRDFERRKREEERERAAEVERQKRMEYQNYMEFKQLEREREKLRFERERIEKEKMELIRLERERQKAEREKIEKEKEELRRAKMNIGHSHRSEAVKRPFEADKGRRRDSVERKKPYTPDRSRKLDDERESGRERYGNERLHHSDGRGRSPLISREGKRDVWVRSDSSHSSKNLSGERLHRREATGSKVTDRRHESPAMSSGVPDLSSRFGLESSSSRSVTKRPADRYDEPRSSSRDTEWVTRPSYLSAGSSASLPINSSLTSRESWPLTDRKVEAWDTSRLTPRAEQWISGASAAVPGRSSMPSIAPPPPPMYSHAATSGLPLAGANIGLGGYTSDRFETYKSSYLRRF